MFKLLPLIIVAVLAASAGATIIYLPVQFEYGTTEKYYYGGSDPTIFARADRTSQVLTMNSSSAPVTFPTRTYSDLFPYQPNAAVYGFSANDAKNQAYQSVPRYFRMADIVAGGHVERDGTIVVPPTVPGTIEIKPYVRPRVQPTTRPILIIPKPAVVQPAKSDKETVAARNVD